MSTSELNAITSYLKEEKFPDAYSLTKRCPDSLEKSICQCLALIGQGKLYMANDAIKEKVIHLDSPKMFAEYLILSRFDIEDVYTRAQKHQLGYLMLMCLESWTILLPEKEKYIMDKMLLLLQNSTDLGSKERILILIKLKEYNNDPFKLIQYADALISRDKPPPEIFHLAQQNITEALEIYSKEYNEQYEINIAAVNTLMKLKPLDFDLIMQLMENALIEKSERWVELISMYLKLGSVCTKEQKKAFIEKAIKLTPNLNELITNNELKLQIQLQRIIDFYDIYSEALWYRENLEYQVAESLFSKTDAIVRIKEISSLLDQNDLEDERTWAFIKWLFTLLVKEELNQKNQLVKIILENRQDYYLPWKKTDLPQKIVELLMNLSKEYGILEIQKDFDDYFKKKRELNVRDFKMYKMERPGIGGKEIILKDPRPHQEAEPVFLGASAPQAVKKGSEFSARFVAYIKGLEHEIEMKLLKMSPQSTPHLELKTCRWQQGTRIKIKLYGNYLSVNPSEEEFTWEGNMNIVDFDVTVSKKVPETATILKFDVLINEFVVARLRIDLQIVTKPRKTIRQTVKGKPIITAFASYASQDRQRVLDRVSEIQRNGIDVFLDCLSIHPGEQWKPRLEKEIKERESFLLFWSSYAKQSEMVSWEWHTALNYKGIDGIQPHPLCPVSEAEPPEELKDLHFGDVYMLVREASNKQPNKGGK